MDLSTFAAITVVLLVFYVGIRYCTKVIRKEISPRIATWLIFEIGVVMSLASYLAGSEHNLLKAALNAANSLQVTVILIVLMREHRNQKIRFTRNELLSLGIAGMAALAWIVTKAGWIGFIGFQSLMCIAYLPTIESLWHCKQGPPPEPMEKWGINILIALMGGVVDITGIQDYLAMVYPLRALILCIVVVILIARWKRKSAAEDHFANHLAQGK